MGESEIIEPISADGRTQTKGTLMRGWSEVLRQRGVMEKILARLTPEVQVLLRDPPASTEWIDIALFECIAEAVRLELGEDVLDDLFLRAQQTGWVALLSRWASGVARVFGATPAVVLRHAHVPAKANTVGMSITWTDLGERRGELTAHYPFRPRIHRGAAWGTSTACQLAADVVGATIKRELPVVEPDPTGGTRVRARISW